jgi:UDP-N-acetylglucosamine 1-carboxyvinyltransferase
VTKQLVAGLLTDQPCVLHGVPRIVEVELVLGMLEELGTLVTWLDGHTVRVHTPKVTGTSLSAMYSGVNRIPILMMGPLLHRRGETVVPLPGGCTIGKRPIDFHLEGLRQMGADIVEHTRSVKVHADRLTGAHTAAMR